MWLFVSSVIPPFLSFWITYYTPTLPRYHAGLPKGHEALDFIDRRTKINIEIKAEGMAKAVHVIMAKYVREKGWSWDDFLVSSFNHYELLDFQKYAPQVKIGVLVESGPLK